jgi:hypothetical protein
MRIFASFLLLLLPLLGVFPGNLMGEEENERWGIGFHPIIGYDGETSLTIGAGGVIYFVPARKDQDLDEIQFQTSYNLKHQYDFSLKGNKYFRGNDLSVEGSISFQKYPDDFNGIGDDWQKEWDYDASYIPFEIGCLLRLRDRIFIGPRYDFQYAKIDALDTNSAPPEEKIIGVGTKYTSGFGGQILYKNMPSGHIYRRQGNSLKISGIHYSSLFLSSFTFTNIGLDYRHYFPVLAKSVLAFQVVYNASLGQVPFYELTSVGDSEILRGGGSESGHYFSAAQVEFRFPLFWRFGAATFLGVGEVEESMLDFGSNTLAAGGAGMRLTLNKKKTINLRFDFARNSQGDSELYIKIKEAF